MSDPLSALSAAAAILQFVEFSSKLLTTGIRIYKATTGTSEVNDEIERHAEDVRELTGGIDIASANSQLMLSANEKKIVALAKQCQDVSQKLLDLLEDLKVKATGARRVVAVLANPSGPERTQTGLNI